VADEKKKTARPKTSPKPGGKDDQVRIRLTAEQKDLMTAAAKKAGLGLSPWLLMLGLREANSVEK
jgi:uncharacterized protein (DUF1778 family)